MVRLDYTPPRRLTTKRSPGDSGFGLIELLMLIVIIGILAAIATSSLDNALGKHRQAKTEREMQAIIQAIAGDPARMTGGIRSDFGYVGDVGAFPASLDELYGDPGYSTWHGPYVDVGLIQDSTGFLADEWGSAYQYDGSLTITSIGSGTSLSASLTGSTEDYLINRVIGSVIDAAGNPPGVDYMDSVELSLTIPDGIGGLSVRQVNPLWTGSFEFDSLPVGRHDLIVVYIPTSDTLHREVTVLPRNRNDIPLMYKFMSAYFEGGEPAPTSLILRPNGVGSLTGLAPSGCASNYLCVNESIADDDATRVLRAASSYASDLYSMQDPGAVSGTISSVIAFARTRRNAAQGNVKLIVKTQGSQYEGADQAQSPGWNNYSNNWTGNPSTGVDWTWQDIIDIEAGVSLKGQSVIHPAYCTQVWLVVEYVP